MELISQVQCNYLGVMQFSGCKWALPQIIWKCTQLHSCNSQVHFWITLTLLNCFDIIVSNIMYMYIGIGVGQKYTYAYTLYCLWMTTIILSARRVVLECSSCKISLCAWMLQGFVVEFAVDFSVSICPSLTGTGGPHEIHRENSQESMTKSMLSHWKFSTTNADGQSWQNGSFYEFMIFGDRLSVLKKRALTTSWIALHHFIFRELISVIITPPITPNNFWGFNKRNSQEKCTLWCPP